MIEVPMGVLYAVCAALGAVVGWTLARVVWWRRYLQVSRACDTATEEAQRYRTQLRVLYDALIPGAVRAQLMVAALDAYADRVDAGPADEQFAVQYTRGGAPLYVGGWMRGVRDAINRVWNANPIEELDDDDGRWPAGYDAGTRGPGHGAHQGNDADDLPAL